MAGFRRGVLVKTGDRAYCMVGEWRSMSDIVNARPQMIAILDGIRDLLEDLGSGQGVTDPVSGEAVVEINPPKAARRRRKKAKPKKAAARPDRREGAQQAREAQIACRTHLQLPRAATPSRRP